MKRASKSTDGTLLFQCPGCTDFVRSHPNPDRANNEEQTHQVTYHGCATEKPNTVGAKWAWNGSLEKPTLSPSVLVHGVKHKDGGILIPRCHSFVRDGRIQFLADCDHALAGKTVDLPEV